MKFCTIGTACCVFLIALQGARAQTPEAKERAARKACLLGDVAKGSEILADLYIDTKDPTHIYNQGRCYEQNGQNQAAILRFREYLRTAVKLPAADAAMVEKKIAELQEKDKISGAPAVVVPPPPAPASVAASPPLPPAAPAPVVSEDPAPLQITQPLPAPETSSAPVYKRWWFWGGIGVVVAGGVAAALLLTSTSGAKHSPPCVSGAICVP